MWRAADRDEQACDSELQRDNHPNTRDQRHVEMLLTSGHVD